MVAARKRILSLPHYAELHCRSNFSFLSGASHPEELVERAQDLGYSALAITDECSLAGVVRAHIEAQERKLHLIIGSEFQLTLPPPQQSKWARSRKKNSTAAAANIAAPAAPGTIAPPHARLVMLAQSRRGYGNLSHWITVARRRAVKGQ